MNLYFDIAVMNAYKWYLESLFEEERKSPSDEEIKLRIIDAMIRLSEVRARITQQLANEIDNDLYVLKV